MTLGSNPTRSTPFVKLDDKQDADPPDAFPPETRRCVCWPSLRLLVNGTAKDAWLRVGFRTRCAIRIQMAYRRHSLETYSCLGEGGGIAELAFPASRNVAKVIILRTRQRDPHRAALVVRIMDLQWQMLRPTVIFSVTGGAQNLRLSQDKELALMEGLVSAAQVSGAAIISAGTDAGLAQLLGQAMKETKHVDVPLIGIAPFGSLLGHTELTNHLSRRKRDGNHLLLSLQMSAGKLRYDHTGRENTRDAAALEPNHSHLILCDDGSRGNDAWGSEIELRSQIYLQMRKRFYAPTVLVVVQGGSGTLRTVREALFHSIPTVLVGGSGGAADLLIRWLGADTEEPGEMTGSLGDGSKVSEEWLQALRTEVIAHRAHISYIHLGQVRIS